MYFLIHIKVEIRYDIRLTESLCRCNQNYDCQDGSDEASCRIIEIDENKYLKDKPPVVDLDSLVTVTIDVEITNILLIDEVKQYLL